MHISIDVFNVVSFVMKTIVLIVTLCGYCYTIRWLDRRLMMDNWMAENAAYIVAGILWCMVGLLIGGFIK